MSQTILLAGVFLVLNVTSIVNFIHSVDIVKHNVAKKQQFFANVLFLFGNEDPAKNFNSGAGHIHTIVLLVPI